MNTRLFSLVFICLCSSALAQTSKTDKGSGTWVNEKRFVFVARSVTPTGGMGLRNLTTTYTVTVLPDSVIADLPYFGQMYQAPMGSQDNGIKFTSTQFDYSQKEGKKGKVSIKIKPKDVRIAPQLFLTVFSNGSASLRVSCVDRQPISYDGIIEQYKK